MIKIGEYNTLEILRETSVGLFLGDPSGEEVLLPNKYCPESFTIGDDIKVFVYLDYAERLIATNIHPKIALYEINSIIESVNSRAFFELNGILILNRASCSPIIPIPTGLCFILEFLASGVG